MPTTRIEIENINNRVWVAELEFAGMTAFRVVHRAETFFELIDKLVKAYEDRTGEHAPRPRMIEGHQMGDAPYLACTVSSADSLEPVFVRPPPHTKPDISGANHWTVWKAKVEAAGGTFTTVAAAKEFLSEKEPT